MIPQLLTMILVMSIQSPGDSVYTFHLADKTITYRSSLRELSRFQQFLDSCAGKTPQISRLALADVTGDGIADSCYTSVTLVGNLPFIRHAITSQGRLIWYDTLTLVNAYVSTSYWEDDSSYSQLMPYSGFFLAKLFFTDFVAGALDTANLPHSYFINVLHADHRQEWLTRYRQFRGHLINGLNISDPPILIWDNRDRKFIYYFAS